MARPPGPAPLSTRLSYPAVTVTVTVNRRRGGRPHAYVRSFRRAPRRFRGEGVQAKQRHREACLRVGRETQVGASMHGDLVGELHKLG
jgi:hypothetical protein